MAYEGPSMDFSAKANSDLSTKQFCFVKLVGDNLVDICTAITDSPAGVLQGTPSIGQVADVRPVGVTKLVASAALSAGTHVSTTTSGTAVACVAGTNTTAYNVGYVMQSNANAGGYVTAFIVCPNAPRAT